MLPYPIPEDEPQRLAVLHRYALLDTSPDAAFDRLASLAARLFDIPLALVTLVDENRQWFKACQGPAAAGVSICETPRGMAFCAHTILAAEAMVVEDARLDARFAENPLVTGPPYVRFYAGAPLLTPEGYALGSLCLIDVKPRTFSASQQAALQDLAASVVSEMDLHRAATTLAQSERLYRKMFESNPHPMWVFEVESQSFLAVNDRAIAHYGFTREEFLAMTLGDIRPPQEREHLRDVRTVASTSSDHRGISWHWKKDGTRIRVDITSHEIEFGDRAARLVIADDVTERLQAEEAQRQSEERLQAVVSNLPVIVWALDQSGVFTLSDGRGLEGMRLNPGEVVGRNALELYADYPDICVYLKEALAGRRRFWVSDFDGITYETHISPIHGARVAQDGIIGVSYDVTERRRLESDRETLLAQTEALLAEALDKADHDPLTGLLNHRAFHICLKEEIENAKANADPLALLVLDLDNFKFFNEVYGHSAGDDVLRQVTQALGACCGARDTLARFGGDEFALLMPGADREAASHMVTELRQALSLVGYCPPGYYAAIPFSLSVGAACLPDDGGRRTELLEAADARLRAAKSGDGEGQAMVLRQSLTSAREGFSMLDALVTAVDNKDRYTRRHSEDVMAHSLQIARRLELPARVQRIVEVAALLHDVGKIGVPDAILRKPGELSDKDFEAVKQHPMMGSIIVGAVPGFEETLDAIRHHHERWDGEGYPFGLRGEEIPLMARLMAVADAFSAMTTDRPYRKGMDTAKARLILREGAGTQWDPQCVAAFLAESDSP